MRVIGEFRGPWQFLSNFFIEPDGTHVEGEYQAMKCKYPADAQKFSRLSPVQAKRLGRKVEIRSDWNISRLVIMRALVARKFADHPTLRSALLATGDAELIEGIIGEISSGGNAQEWVIIGWEGSSWRSGAS